MTPETKRKYGKILNTGLNSTSKGKVLAFVRDSISRGYKFWISTPNPEIVLAAQQDKELNRALENSDLAIPDGIGLAQAARFLSLPTPKNFFIRLPVLLLQGIEVGSATFFKREWLTSSLKIIKGRELFIELIKLASNKGWKVFLLGGKPGYAKSAGLNLRKSFKTVRIAYAQGPQINVNGVPDSLEDMEIQKEAVAQINEYMPQLLFVAFGAAKPKQEKWIYKNLPKLKIGGAMGVGGTLDYIAGQASLPPKWAEGNLEWLWRLYSQPWRLGRIFRALIIFPWKVFLSKQKSA